MTPCFLLEPTLSHRRWLRRYAGIPTGETRGPCSGTHDAVRFLDDVHESDSPELGDDAFSHDDPRWPTHCDACGYEFHPVEDRWQLFTLKLHEVTKSVDENYVRVGGIFHLHPNKVFNGGAPAGAMWDASWMGERMENWDPSKPWYLFGPGDDGRILCVRTPGGDWIVDQRASNCGLPNDNAHRCWVRHGEPPDVTVDKAGVTCNAGAGSIQAGDYHGFLQQGRLT